MRTISTKTFKHTLRKILENSEERKFCFVLGAGASRSAGIPTGGELAQKWYAELPDIYSPSEIKAWEKKIGLNKKDLAAYYGFIYQKRFEVDPTDGYDSLIKEMEDARPTIGHVVLSQILSKYKKHCVLTTNFDSLVETAIYQFTDSKPLVCGHESLSGYARPSSRHPLIVKIHRDLLLSPQSSPNEINKLSDG